MRSRLLEETRQESYEITPRFLLFADEALMPQVVRLSSSNFCTTTFISPVVPASRRASRRRAAPADRPGSARQFPPENRSRRACYCLRPVLPAGRAWAIAKFRDGLGHPELDKIGVFLQPRQWRVHRATPAGDDTRSEHKHTVKRSVECRWQEMVSKMRNCKYSSNIAPILPA